MVLLHTVLVWAPCLRITSELWRQEGRCWHVPKDARAPERQEANPARPAMSLGKAFKPEQLFQRGG